MNKIATTVILVIAAGLVYVLWPQIQILIDAFSNRFNL